MPNGKNEEREREYLYKFRSTRNCIDRPHIPPYIWASWQTPQMVQLLYPGSVGKKRGGVTGE
jgi:hypothetical protein